MYRRECWKRVGRLHVYFCTYKSDRDPTINSTVGYCRRRLHPTANSTKPSRSANPSRPQSAQAHKRILRTDLSVVRLTQALQESGTTISNFAFLSALLHWLSLVARSEQLLSYCRQALHFRKYEISLSWSWISSIFLFLACRMSHMPISH